MRSENELWDMLNQVRRDHNEACDWYERTGSDSSRFLVEKFYGQITMLEWMLGLR